MADYNTFHLYDCKARKTILITSSARKCLRELCVGKRIDIWNGNTKTDTVYDRTKDKMRPYVKAEKDYIRKKQKAQTLRNARRKRA